jgi:NhaP-type Na+/H+ or K+/H+ antiporter
MLFVFIRPLGAQCVLVRTPISAAQRGLMGWFGIRGIGSVYYLCYALRHGVEGAEAERLCGLVLPVIALSVLLHGATAQPLLARYARSLATSKAR